MDRVHAELAALKRRMRLQTLAFFGVLAVCATAMGGADAVARAAVGVFAETDAWTIKTLDGGSTLKPRIVVTTGTDPARVKFQNAHVELSATGTAPSNPAAGALWFDDTFGVKRLKFYDGSTWIGTAPIDPDAWRLVFSASTSLTLKGIGQGGGTININGAVASYTSDPVLSNSGLSASTLYRIYAYLNSGTVTLEASTTTSTADEYGVYSYKTGDSSRRFVGLAYTNTGAQFTVDMVRSARNEPGYSVLKHYQPAGAAYPQTGSTSWVDIDATNLSVYGLFFANEKVVTWMDVNGHPYDNNVTRLNYVTISFDGTDLADAQRGNHLNRGTAYADPTSVLKPLTYVSVGSSGRKLMKGRFKTYSGYYAFLVISNANPTAIGAHVQH